MHILRANCEQVVNKPCNKDEKTMDKSRTSREQVLSK